MIMETQNQKLFFHRAPKREKNKNLLSFIFWDSWMRDMSREHLGREDNKFQIILFHKINNPEITIEQAENIAINLARSFR